MSWGRIDDSMWHHEKFEPLREQGAYDAIALFALAISYTGQKMNPRLTLKEAAMLLCCDEAKAQGACVLLRTHGLLDDAPCLGFASDKTPTSWIVHDWINYRSKNEARAYAGRKGGKKSGESRRERVEAKPEANDAAGFEATSKQNRSPGPDPEPVPDPGPDDKTEPVVASRPEQSATTLTKALEAAGLALEITPTDRKRWWNLYQADPVTNEELSYAIGRALEKKPSTPGRFVLGVIEGQRRDANALGDAPRRPPPPVSNDRDVMASERPNRRAL